jgi:hypothetical protein
VGYGSYKELMDDFETRAAGFFLAGHYREGVSLGDSIVSGHNAADRISAFLARQPETPDTDPTELSDTIPV